MTKYSFLLMSSESEQFLASLQELGLVDIMRSHKPINNETSAMLDRINEIKRTVTLIENAPVVDCAADSLPTSADEIISLTNRCNSRKGEITIALDQLRRDLSARAPWGEYDPTTISDLEQKGLTIRFYVISKKRYNPSWEEQYAIQVISESEGNLYFVTVAKSDEEYSFPIAAIAAPKCSISSLEESIKSLENEFKSCECTLSALKCSVETLKKESSDILIRMDRELASCSATSAADDMVTIFTGFVPTERDEQMMAFLDKMSVYYISTAAEDEDNPPIKLRNGKFARMFEVLTGMYGMPVYGEYDPTPILAPFFLLFFAMCMGDAGYGLLLVILGFVLKNTGMAKLGPLVSTLGVGTAVIGFFLGTFFGIPLVEQTWMPEILKNCILVGNVAGYDLQMVLAIAIGVFHLCLAMTIKAVGYTKRFGIKENISTWGWLVLILGGIILAALAFTGVISSGVTKIAVVALGTVSALSIFIFNTPGRNPLINIGAGLWDTYNMVTGLLGDVLSYIRLYALGLAGGMLGNAFNELGTMVLGDGGINWIFFVLIVIFGHVLNLAMSCLGAFVHPLRLTFVEYFKNAGYEGKGTAYRPLTTNNIEN